MPFALFIAMSSATLLQAQSSPPSISVFPKVATDSVKDDADDPAIWIHPTDPSKSLIIGTDKGKVDRGFYVWNLRGEQIQYVALARPNNVDVRYGMKLGNRLVDIAVTNVRHSKEIKIFAINPADGILTDITTDAGIKTPELDEPYGLCLYQRPSDGAIFVIESSDDELLGESANSLHQYRLLDDGYGKVKGVYVRTFGQNTIDSAAEKLVADDELGFVYAADEGTAIRKYYADPDQGNNEEIAAFGFDDGILGDREGLAIYRSDSKTGYLLVSNQEKGTEFSSIKVYRREGDDGNPHQHSLLATINTMGSADTDGLDVTSRPALPEFPYGFLVKHDAPGRCFKLYSWKEIAKDHLKIASGDSESP
ncbi:MAG: phytase [Nitrososphaera sp.]